MSTMWLVRAGRNAEYIETFLNSACVAIGGAKVGPFSESDTKESLLEKYAQHYPEEKEGTRAVWASQALRFVQEMKIGDAIATYDQEQRVYILGVIESGCEWAPNLFPEMPNVRRVKWKFGSARQALSSTTRNSLGAISSFFRVNPDAAADLEKHQVTRGATATTLIVPRTAVADVEEEAELALIGQDTLEKADGFIEDAIDRLEWDEMQELVAGILRAMGYRTTISPPGYDLGVDIFASPDGLGLQEPRIFVEVKHRNAQMGTKEIRSFLGGRKKGDRCLYVSTGGFSKDARYEAERSDIPINLLNLSQLRQLLLEHYERLDAATRALVPLRKLYWPIGNR